MVNSPKVRHSKSTREPVTIDLDAEPATDEARAKDDPKPAGAAADAPLLDDVPPVPPKPETKASARVRDEAARASSTPAGPSASPPPAPMRRGGASAVAAGVIGAVIALAGAGALQFSGVLPSPGTSGTEIEALRGELATLRQEVAASPPAQDLSPRLSQLSAALDETRAELQALRSGAAPAVDTAALDERFKALEAQLSTVGQQAGAADLGPVTQRLDALEAAIGETRQSVAGLATIEQKLADMDGRLSELGARLAEQAEQPGAALAIAASGLKAAIDRGDPFMTELETFAAVSPASPEVETLRGMAASGVPALTAILDAFPAAASAMVAAATPADPNAGFLDRLMSSAQSLVQVRPVGTVEGDDAPAIVARMEAALKRGDLASVVAEYGRLPDASKAAGADFIAAVKAREAADGLIGTILSAALKA